MSSESTSTCADISKKDDGKETQAQVQAQAQAQAQHKETWTEVSYHEVIHAYVKAECGMFHRYAPAMRATLCESHFSTILTRPNFQSHAENELRHRALMSSRRWMWSEFPMSTKWYRVDDFALTQERFESSIRVPWPELRANSTVDVDDVLLFTHDRQTYTCIEGNHRLTRWKHEGGKPMAAKIYVAQSPDGMVWHDGAAATLEELKTTNKCVYKFVAGAAAYDPISHFGRSLNVLSLTNPLPWLSDKTLPFHLTADSWRDRTTELSHVDSQDSFCRYLESSEYHQLRLLFDFLSKSNFTWLTDKNEEKDGVNVMGTMIPQKEKDNATDQNENVAKDDISQHNQENPDSDDEEIPASQSKPLKMLKEEMSKEEMGRYHVLALEAEEIEDGLESNGGIFLPTQEMYNVMAGLSSDPTFSQLPNDQQVEWLAKWWDYVKADQRERAWFNGKKDAAEKAYFSGSSRTSEAAAMSTALREWKLQKVATMTKTLDEKKISGAATASAAASAASTASVATASATASPPTTNASAFPATATATHDKNNTKNASK